MAGFLWFLWSYNDGHVLFFMGLLCLGRCFAFFPVVFGVFFFFRFSSSFSNVFSRSPKKPPRRASRNWKLQYALPELFAECVGLESEEIAGEPDRGVFFKSIFFLFSPVFVLVFAFWW